MAAAIAGGSPIALVDHDQFVNVTQRRRDGAKNAGGRLQDGRRFFVELLPGLGLAKDGGGFRDALRFNGFGLGQADGLDLGGLGAAFGFDRRGPAGALLAQLLLFSFARSPSCMATEDLIFESRCASASPIVASRFTSAVRRLPSALRHSSSSSRTPAQPAHRRG